MGARQESNVELREAMYNTLAGLLNATVSEQATVDFVSDQTLSLVQTQQVGVTHSLSSR